MRRTEVIEKLILQRDALRALGAKSLFLYGSHARDVAGAASDIDVFIDRDPQAKFGFMELTGMVQMLEDLFGTKIDLVTRTGLHPHLRPEIERSAIQVF